MGKKRIALLSWVKGMKEIRKKHRLTQAIGRKFGVVNGAIRRPHRAVVGMEPLNRSRHSCHNLPSVTSRGSTTARAIAHKEAVKQSICGQVRSSEAVLINSVTVTPKPWVLRGHRLTDCPALHLDESQDS